MKTQFFTVLFILVFNGINGQSFQILGDKCFGGSDVDFGKNILKSGTDLIFIGESHSEIGGNKTVPLCDTLLLPPNDMDLWLVSCDSSNNFNWQRSIGGNDLDRYPFIAWNSDSSSLFFSSISESDSSCEKGQNNKNYPLPGDDYWFGKLDLQGNVIWENTIGGSSSEFDPKIISFSNEDFLVCGSSLSPIGGDKTVTNFGSFDWWFVKFDNLGNKLWDKNFGGTAMEFSDDNRSDAIGLENDNLIFAGSTLSSNNGTISEINNGLQDIWVAKMDSSGIILWESLYGGNSGEFVHDIKQTIDNGFIFCGSTRSGLSGDVSESPKGIADIWVVKIDSVGNKLWDKRFGGTSIAEGRSVEQTSDGGYLVAGMVQGSIGFDVTEIPYGTKDYWVLKLDSLGNKLWDKRFGGPGENYLRDILILQDSSILLFGAADFGLSAVKSDPGYGQRDIWMLRFSYSDTTTQISNLETVSYSVYPNPVRNKVVFSVNNSFDSHILINDMLGNEIFSRDFTDELEIDLTGYSAGCYFYILNSNNKSSNGKLIKL